MFEKLYRWLIPAACLAAGGTLPSCSPFKPPGPPPRAEYVLYQWRDDGVGGPVKIRIDLNSQRLTAFCDKREVGWCVVATGLEGHRTPAGSYRISEKVEDKYSTLYGVIKNPEGITINSDARTGRDRIPPGCKFVPAPMPYWQRLTNYGIGMHAGPIPRPGEPASHGCIRMPREFAPLLFGATKLGTPVTITR